ncbi:VOC family protein [Aurantiacibacter poecillastricola]|uniref:VOC family protein n=1 Tax=Aurantiacibacter poecillastricola TaxID=3064385 RepID=UPI00273E47A4|nr:VOC family protein [Aurantiacibacter sp. 219JJ12-13]MDP5262443.1 VOC family protein [Aurantiacibacter sp. 219JJ12-13]
MRIALATLAATALAACTASAQEEEVRTPEGALLDTSGDLAYAIDAFDTATLEDDNRALFAQGSMNVFRRFPRELTGEMVRFYTEALALRSLNPIQLTDTQQMILTGVGSGQVKLSAGQQGERSYDLSGGWTGGTGIRYLRLTYPDAETVIQRFEEAGFEPPTLQERGDGTRSGWVSDPAGLIIEIVTGEDFQDHSNDGVGVGIGVSDMAESRAFYREFVGLDELDAQESAALGITRYPYNHGETTIYLHQVDANAGDTGSSGIQYVVSDAAMVDVRARHRDIPVETPLNRLRGFDLTTVWLNDPDGVTNYFAQVGPNSRTAQERDD